MDREALIHFIGGAVGGTAGTAITCPLEVIKTRLQSSSYKESSDVHSSSRIQPSSPASRSQPSTSGDTSRTKFVRSDIPYNRVISSMNATNLLRNVNLSETYKRLIPLSNVYSVRYRGGEPRVHGSATLIKYVSEIVRNEGVNALYKGLLPNLVGVAPSKAVYFYTYSTCKRLCNHSDIFVPNSAITHMLSAGFAGFVTSTAINPVWLVKTRLQLHQGPLTIRNCINKIYRTEGIRGFYKGVTASYMGISETIIQFVLYEHFRSIIDDIEFSQENTRFANFMLAGGAAKFCACIMTYPHEVVRTRLREENSKAKGFFGTFGQLYKEGGYRLLYRGLSVQLLRSVPNTAITMGAYEVVVYILHTYV